MSPYTHPNIHTAICSPPHQLTIPKITHPSARPFTSPFLLSYPLPHLPVIHQFISSSSSNCTPIHPPQPPPIPTPIPTHLPSTHPSLPPLWSGLAPSPHRVKNYNRWSSQSVFQNPPAASMSPVPLTWSPRIPHPACHILGKCEPSLSLCLIPSWCLLASDFPHLLDPTAPGPGADPLGLDSATGTLHPDGRSICHTHLPCLPAARHQSWQVPGGEGQGAHWTLEEIPERGVIFRTRG